MEWRGAFTITYKGYQITFMKVKHILALFLITFIIMTIGALFKVMHWPYGNEFIILATIIKVIVGILAIWKLFTMQGFKDFLNK